MGRAAWRILKAGFVGAFANFTRISRERRRRFSAVPRGRAPGRDAALNLSRVPCVRPVSRRHLPRAWGGAHKMSATFRQTEFASGFLRHINFVWNWITTGPGRKFADARPRKRALLILFHNPVPSRAFSALYSLVRSLNIPATETLRSQRRLVAPDRARAQCDPKHTTRVPFGMCAAQ